MIATRRPRNAPETTRSILAAARTLFAEHGLAGTSLQMVEARCGVSKGLILHHFGSKQRLWEAVLKDAFEEYTAWLKSRVSFAASFPELMRDTIRAAYRYYAEHDEIRRLRCWAQLQADPSHTGVEERFTHALIKAVSDAQAAGHVRQDIPALQVPFLIRAAIDYRLNNQPLVRRIEHEGGMNKKQGDENFVTFLSALFLKPDEKEG